MRSSSNARAAIATLGLGIVLLGATTFVERHEIARFPPARTPTAHFSTPIQHIVVIVMENRTVDNLFAGYYGLPFPGGGTWDSALDLYDPNNRIAPLTPNSLSARFDPKHGHDGAFTVEAAGQWDREKFSCPGRCPPGTTAYSYVPTMETNAYRQLVTHWAFARDVRQANEGPSWPAHQYLIAGQAGGVHGAFSAPFAEAENPGRNGRSDQEAAEDDGDSPESPDVVRSGRFCGRSAKLVTQTIDMRKPYAQREGANPEIQPCEEYGREGLGTILDASVARFGPPEDGAWQYIAHSAASIWAAPLGVRHLSEAYESAKDKGSQPFSVDPDAARFIRDLYSPAPSRPFARLTYITPCFGESDHPIVRGRSDGPEWLAYVVNSIGESKYWSNTAILVVWDDWGGFFDHVAPIHPFPNAYPVPNSPLGNPSDPYEYGFRVPLMVISPYVRRRAYVSTKTRSYSSILRYVEDTFDLPSLDTDDAYNDDLGDLFDYSRQPLPYVPVENVGSPKKTC